MAESEVLIVGGGIVGLACAIEAQRRGHDVMLIERDQPGHGCSIGNAGILAVSEVFPLVSRARVAELPRMLLSRDAPAVVRLASLPRFASWMIRAATSLSVSRQSTISDGVAALNTRAVAAWRDLLSESRAGHLLRERGMIRLVRDGRDWASMAAIRDKLAERSIASSMVSGPALLDLEPHLAATVIGGLQHDSDADIGDPLLVSRAFVDRFLGCGGRLVREEVLALHPHAKGVEIITCQGRHNGTRVAVTAGLDGAALLKPLGAVVPLQAERGYNLSIAGGGHRLGRPVTFHRESCVATPMGSALRLAGTVEFAQSSAAPDWRRADRLAVHAERYFRESLDAASSSRWIGSRPSLPDSLPAIGRLRSSPAVLYAFGHQHLGITQAAISARLIGEMLGDRTPSVDLRPYDLARFDRRSVR